MGLNTVVFLAPVETTWFLKTGYMNVSAVVCIKLHIGRPLFRTIWSVCSLSDWHKKTFKKKLWRTIYINRKLFI